MNKFPIAPNPGGAADAADLVWITEATLCMGSLTPHHKHRGQVQAGLQLRLLVATQTQKNMLRVWWSRSIVNALQLSDS